MESSEDWNLRIGLGYRLGHESTHGHQDRGNGHLATRWTETWYLKAINAASMPRPWTCTELLASRLKR